MRSAVVLAVAAIFSLCGAVANSHDEAGCLREFSDQRIACWMILGPWFCKFDEEKATQRCKNPDHLHSNAEALQEDGTDLETTTENE